MCVVYQREKFLRTTKQVKTRGMQISSLYIIQLDYIKINCLQKQLITVLQIIGVFEQTEFQYY